MLEERTNMEEDLLDKLYKIGTISKALEENDSEMISNMNDREPYYMLDEELSSIQELPTQQGLKEREWTIEKNISNITLTFKDDDGLCQVISYWYTGLTLLQAVYDEFSCAMNKQNKRLVETLLNKKIYPSVSFDLGDYFKINDKKIKYDGCNIEILCLLLNDNVKIHHQSTLKPLVDQAIKQRNIKCVNFLLDHRAAKNGNLLLYTIRSCISTRNISMFSKILNSVMDKLGGCEFINKQTVECSINNKQYALTARLLIRMILENKALNEIPKDTIKMQWARIKNEINLGVFAKEMSKTQFTLKYITLAMCYNVDVLQQNTDQSPWCYGLETEKQAMDELICRLEENILESEAPSNNLANLNLDAPGHHIQH